MKKLIFFLVIVLLVLSGCENKNNILESVAEESGPNTGKESSVDNEFNNKIVNEDSIGNRSVESNSDNGVINETAIKKFLNGEYLGENKPDSIQDVVMPVAIGEIQGRIIREYEDIVKEEGYEGDFEIIPTTELSFSELEEKMPIVNANRAAQVYAQVPYYDNSRDWCLRLNYAEVLMDCDITWARDTGIRVPETENEWRMYTIAKAETGGYIYTFFDYNKTTGATRIKYILYIDRIYNRNDFADIQVGDSIEEVASFDNATALMAKLSDEYNKVKAKFYYLDDGILVIRYRDRVVDGMMYVDYTHPNGMDKLANDNSRSCDLTILPQDYPPAS